MGDQGIVSITDGADDAFMEDAAGEVLYENTGASRYFMRNFSKDITDYGSPKDFLESDWFAMDEDRGIARRHRVGVLHNADLGVHVGGDVDGGVGDHHEATFRFVELKQSVIVFVRSSL